MRHLVVISEPNAWPQAWGLREFQVHHLPPHAKLPPEVSLDCVALVQPPPGEVDALLQDLRTGASTGATAVLLAGRPDAFDVISLLDQHQFDGFLDFAWPAGLAEASLRTALHHVESGRNLVEIQRVVIEESRQETSSLYEQAVHDGLTHLFNVRHFAELMAREHERSQRRGESYALVVIDLDDLKQLNTEHGHAGGSQALHELATLIAASTRAADVAVRLGGDEFAVFLADCTRSQGVEFANRLCARLRAHSFDVDGRALHITVSCGVASYPEDGLDYPELLKRADHALLQAKTLGKNRVVGFRPSLALHLES